MSDLSQMSGAAARSMPQAEPLVNRIWPHAIVGLALAVTGAWICVLAYGLGRLVALLI